jgi:hypothetical protein
VRLVLSVLGLAIFLPGRLTADDRVIENSLSIKKVHSTLIFSLADKYASQVVSLLKNTSTYPHLKLNIVRGTESVVEYPFCA